MNDKETEFNTQQKELEYHKENKLVHEKKIEELLLKYKLLYMVYVTGFD